MPSWQAMHLSSAFGLSRLAIMFGMFEPPLPKDDSVPDEVLRRQVTGCCGYSHGNIDINIVDIFYILSSFILVCRTR